MTLENRHDEGEENLLFSLPTLWNEFFRLEAHVRVIMLEEETEQEREDEGLPTIEDSSLNTRSKSHFEKRRLVIIGGGATSCELGQSLARILLDPNQQRRLSPRR